MEDVAELQDMVKFQLDNFSKTKTKSNLSLLLPSHKSYGDQTGSTKQQQPNSVALKFEPHLAFDRTNRVIKHTTDKFVVDTEYSDTRSLSSEIKSIASSLRTSQSKSYLSKNPLKFPAYNSLNSVSTPAYQSGHHGGKLRKLGVTRLVSLVDDKPAYKNSDDYDYDADENNSASMQSTAKSVNELFQSTFMQRESRETRKLIDADRCFTTKIVTPRLLKLDPDSRFKSKDLVNTMIEDVSVMSMASLATKGQSLSYGSTGTLGEWKTMYEKEKNNYDSTALYAEVNLAREVSMGLCHQYSFSLLLYSFLNKLHPR
jgi:hypothetical protein